MRRGRLPSPRTCKVAAWGGYLGRSQGAPAAARTRTRPPSVSSRSPAAAAQPPAARPALAGTSTRGEARADRVASTMYVSCIVSTAIGVTADLSAARRGRSREVSGQRRARARCVCACVRPHVLAPPGAAAAAASLPGPRARVVHDLPASFAAPSQRRRRARIRPSVEAVSRPAAAATAAARAPVVFKLYNLYKLYNLKL